MRALAFLSLLLCLSCSVIKTLSPLHPFTGKQEGCGDFIVYQFNEEGSEYVSVAFDVSAIEWESFQAYVIGKAEVLTVKRKKYAGKIDTSLCIDTNNLPELLSEETAVRGIVEIQIKDEDIQKAQKGEQYSVTLTLKEVHFADSVIDYLLIPNVAVG